MKFISKTFPMVWKFNSGSRYFGAAADGEADKKIPQDMKKQGINGFPARAFPINDRLRLFPDIFN
jgi:hypothetical protein